MNSPNDETDDLRAAEYVLGTLDEQQTAELHRQMDSDPELRRRVTEWQEKLQPLAEAIEPVVPSSAVWRRLSYQLNLDDARVGEASRSNTVARFDPDRRSKRKKTKTKLIVWQWVGSVAMAACGLLAVALWQTQRAPVEAPLFDVVSIVSAEDSSALWVINASLQNQTVQVTAIAPPDINDNQDHQLWMVKPDNEGVLSLGILPREANTTLKTVIPDLQDDAVAFAVSLEPLGGSPEPVPTGPVLFQAGFNKVSE